MEIELCEKRISILESTRNLLVTGGPGCGKTTIALKLALNSLPQLQSGQKILFLSFSRAAVGRILQATKGVVPAEQRQYLEVQTFHSFFWNILKTHGYLLGAPKKLRIYLPHDEAVLRNGEDELTDEWLTTRERLFTEDGHVVFDLFAPKTLALLKGSEVIRKIISNIYPIIIVDEAQDTAQDQWECIRFLSKHSRIVCLADLDQQIYDFRPGVGPERINDIKSDLEPFEVDLQGENRRSPTTEIVNLGNDILLGQQRQEKYNGISHFGISPKKENRDKTIRSAIGYVNKKVKEVTGEAPSSIAVLTSWGKGVNAISAALDGDKENKTIPYQVLIDECQVLLASRILAFCLEPINGVSERAWLVQFFLLVSDMQGARGGKGALSLCGKLKDWSKNEVGSRHKTTKLYKDALDLYAKISGIRFSGDARRDWLTIRNLLWSSGSEPIRQIATEVQHLMVFRRGKIIASLMGELWRAQQTYAGISKQLELILTEDQISNGLTDLSGINVMTIHKSKGKEFDAVILIDLNNISPFVSKEPAPYPRARKLVRVGITRARHHVLILTDSSRATPILEGFAI